MTPNRVITFLRTGSLLIVVLGHWVMQGLYVDPDGELRRSGLLQIAPWTHPFTWLLQVMPLFFVLGGYSNLASWRRTHTSGRGYGAWLRARAGRLTAPLVPLMLFWLLVVPAAGLLGLGPDWLRVAGRASLVPTWFLAVYLLVVAATPLTVRAWERWGWGSVVAAAAIAVVVEATALITGSYWVGVPNVLLVWGTLHQLGYAWHDRRPSREQALAASSVALVALVTLVTFGPYAVSMVGVDGFGVSNNDPTRVTILLLGAWQAGIALAAEPWLARVLQRPRLWTATVVLGSRAMTVYLWHLTVLGMAAAISLWAGGLGLGAAPGSTAWWWTRPPWFVLLGVLTWLVVALAGRVERHDGAGPDDQTPSRALAGVLATCLALGALAWVGLVPRGTDAVPLPVWLLLWVPVLAHGLISAPRSVRVSEPRPSAA